MRLKLLSFWLFANLAFSPLTPLSAAEYFVGGQNSSPKDHTFETLSDVPWDKLMPGDDVLVDGGTNDSVVTITAHGTPDHPITIRAAPGTSPVNERPIIFEGATYVTVDGLTVHDTMWPGFMIRHGAEGITISHSTVYDTGEGVWIADGAGMNHRILNNILRNNKTFGIGVDGINNIVGKETIIAGNTITDNKIHGIEIIGNHYIIESNVVSGNGWDTQGSSGIHLYAKSATADTCKHNIIRYNMSYANKDDGGQDGNGIQIDQWCDDNQVYFNVTFANEGAGISLYDAADNVVFNNTIFDNMKGNSGHSYRTEFLLGSDSNATDHSSHNVIMNNIIYVTRADNVAMYVDARSSRHPQEIRNNILYQENPAGKLFFWGGKTGKDVLEWNALKGGAPDSGADPQFNDPSRPLKGGLSLKPTSLANRGGAALAMRMTQDASGQAVPVLPIGAYGALP